MSSLSHKNGFSLSDIGNPVKPLWKPTSGKNVPTHRDEARLVVAGERDAQDVSRVMPDELARQYGWTLRKKQIADLAQCVLTEVDEKEAARRATILPFGSPHGCAPPRELASRGRGTEADAQALVRSHVPAQGFTQPKGDQISSLSNLSSAFGMPSMIWPRAES
jgi:hypothetical protein